MCADTRVCICTPAGACGFAPQVWSVPRIFTAVKDGGTSAYNESSHLFKRVTGVHRVIFGVEGDLSVSRLL